MLVVLKVILLLTCLTIYIEDLVMKKNICRAIMLIASLSGVSSAKAMHAPSASEEFSEESSEEYSEEYSEESREEPRGRSLIVSKKDEKVIDYNEDAKRSSEESRHEASEKRAQSISARRSKDLAECVRLIPSDPAPLPDLDPEYQDESTSRNDDQVLRQAPSPKKPGLIKRCRSYVHQIRKNF